MKKNIFLPLVIGLFLMILSVSCTSNKNVTTQKEKEVVLNVGTNPEIANGLNLGKNNSLNLVDYLRRVPGLQIEQRGNDVSIVIRGANSISGDNSPLYVIDNQAVGNNYNDAVSAVDVNDIKYVNVLKGSEGQQLYGMRGYNGAIQIFTKKK